MRWKLTFLMFAALFILSGCISTYMPPSSAKPIATVTFRSVGESDLVTPSLGERAANKKSIQLNVYSNNKCETRRVIAVTQPGTREHTITVEAGTRFYFDVDAVISVKTAHDGKSNCRLNSSFVPAAEGSYVVTFGDAEESCYVTLQRKFGTQLVKEASFIREPNCSLQK